MNERKNISSGAPWEAIVGYSRAVRVGNIVHVSGTTSTESSDPAEQTRQTLAKIEGALEKCGATRAHVVRTRVYVVDISQWEAIGRAHGEFFRDVMPASAMVEVRRLIDPAMLVEIEAEAILP